MPKTWFSTPLSKNAKDTEGRIRNIFEGQRRRPAVIVLALVAAVALLCGSGVAVRTKRTVPTMEDRWEREKKEAVAAYAAAADGSAELPAYVYQGDNPYLAAVCDWITSGEGRKYLQAEVTIPCPLIAEIDDSDPQDIRVWGNFWVYSYKAVGTTLLSVSGGECPGLLHLRNVENSYEVFDAELVGDGGAYAKDMRRIFGTFRMMKLDVIDGDALRAQYIADYVRWNDLPFTQYQDYGWDPVHIPGTQETPETAQIIHLVSQMGWSIDYDLREFSHDIAYGELEMLTGVGELQGVSIYFERYRDTDAETVLAERERQMERPRREETFIGADSIPVTLVRDAATRDEVLKGSYVIALNETDTLAVNVSNTYYAIQGDPVVPGADAALAKTLATFRLTVSPSRNTAVEAQNAEPDIVRQEFSSGKAESLDEINLLYTWAELRVASEPVKQRTMPLDQRSVPKDRTGELLSDQTLPTDERVALFRSAEDADRKLWAVDRGDNWEVFCMEDAAYQDGYSVSTYENVLGHNGFCICGPRGAGYSFKDYYYFDEDGAIQYLADGSNLVIETDLNGDGTKEILYLYHYSAVCEFLNDGTVYRCYLPGLLDNIDGWSWHGFDSGRDAEEQVLKKQILPITLHLTESQNVTLSAELRFSANGVVLWSGID